MALSEIGLCIPAIKAVSSWDLGHVVLNCFKQSFFWEAQTNPYIYIYHILYINGSKTKKKTGDTNSFGEFSMWGWILKSIVGARCRVIRGCVSRASAVNVSFWGVLNTSV